MANKVLTKKSKDEIEQPVQAIESTQDQQKIRNGSQQSRFKLLIFAIIAIILIAIIGGTIIGYYLWYLPKMHSEQNIVKSKSAIDTLDADYTPKKSFLDIANLPTYVLEAIWTKDGKKAVLLSRAEIEPQSMAIGVADIEKRSYQ